jgi:hypothetical protein
VFHRWLNSANSCHRFTRPGDGGSIVGCFRGWSGAPHLVGTLWLIPKVLQHNFSAKHILSNLKDGVVDSFIGASSSHSAKVDVVLIDGSVRFIQHAIAQTIIWRSLATRAGGEVINSRSFHDLIVDVATLTVVHTDCRRCAACGRLLPLTKMSCSDRVGTSRGRDIRLTSESPANHSALSDSHDPPGRITVPWDCVKSHLVEHIEVKIAHRLRLESNVPSRRHRPPCPAGENDR